MKAALTNVAFLLCGMLSPVPYGTGLSAPSDGNECAFLFKGVDQKSGVAVLAPLVAPAIGVQLDSGPRKIDRGEVLRCRSEMRTHAAIIEGEPATVSEQVLRCGDGDEQRVLVVKGIIFAKGNG